jgi:hypothetical protein
MAKKKTRFARVFVRVRIGSEKNAGGVLLSRALAQYHRRWGP